MALKKKWTRSNLRKYFMGLGLKFNTIKTPVFITKVFNKNILIIEITDFHIIFYGDTNVKIPIGLIDTLKVKNNYPYLICRIFLLKEQYLEFELKLLAEEIE